MTATAIVTEPARTTGIRARIAGRVITTLTVGFLTVDAITHIANIGPVRDASVDLGIPVHLAPVIGFVMLGCLALYLLPATSVIGAVLLTGYLGGAVTVNMIDSKPLFSTTLFAVYVGVAVWLGLYLRDPRVRALLIARSS